MRAAKLPRRVEGGHLVSVERIIEDERTQPVLGRDGLLVKAPRWDVWLGDPLGRAATVAGRWVRASGFVGQGGHRLASLDHCPSGLTLVARPVPADECNDGECPADPILREL